MLRTSLASYQKLTKARGYDLRTSLFNTSAFVKAKRISKGTVDGERVQGRGAERRRSTTSLQDSMEKMEHPAIWIWYPWRKNPEPPTPAMPMRRALKNAHGAVYSSLSTVQQRRHDEMYYGAARPASVERRHEVEHPFLAKVLKDLGTAPKGFPFWFKKYPTRGHAYQNRFNIPTEMLDGYSDNIKKSLSPALMSEREMLMAQKAMYRERFAQHDYDQSSLPVQCVTLAVQCRALRNHLLKHAHNNIAKFTLRKKEKVLGSKLRVLRRVNFRQYWTILREHDVQDLVQPTNAIKYRWGNHWMHDWNKGYAITTKVADFMDPRGLNGCVETGRSRAEVARDLGLQYTRSLMPNERKALSNEAVYYEKIAKFKAAHPERIRDGQRLAFMRKFSGMFAVMNKKGGLYDFPSKMRRVVGTKVTRWRSVRHGPM